MDSISTYVIIKNTFFFFLLSGVGVSANAYLLLFHIFTFILDHRPKPSDLISCHLALIHMLIDSLHFQNDFTRRAFFFVNGVVRGLSISTTCLLSVFKQKFTNCIIHIFFFLWSLNLSFSSNLIFHTISSSNVIQTNPLILNKYFSLSPRNFIIRRLFFTLTFFRDVSFVGIMLLSSVYMVILLFRHQRRSQHLHSISLSPRSSPEKRDIQTTPILAVFFVVIYWINLIISFSLILLWTYDPDLLHVQMLVLSVYATVSPLVLISSNKRITNILLNIQSKCHQFNKLVIIFFPKNR
uniref:Vomeronasal type-1 receptor n=1 Tax=Sus scrofa TaxID=9823 RepID=A0A8D0U8Q1_PIG